MRHLKYILFLSVLISLTSCLLKPDKVFIDELDKEYQLYDYYIDSYGNEGVVAAIVSSEETSEKAIIVLSFEEEFLPWGPMGEKVYKDSILRSGLLEPYFGVAMLQIMKSSGISRYPAQAWCDEMNKNEKYPRGGSWRLPTVRELKWIFGENGQKVSELNSALSRTGGAPLEVNHKYWTCVEDFAGYLVLQDTITDFDQANRAIVTTPQMLFYTNKDRWLKKNRYYTRAIKYIYYRFDKK